jgi:mRNA interferase HicA
VKQRDLIKRLEAIAAAKDLSLEFIRQGGSHTIYRIGSQNVAIARHREIPEQTALRIIRDVEDI